ncbi:MAG TPA: DUF6702 family protein [Gemmatimonadales bacterium]|nr:DUF6702 family protein [Gemmatimonadales bacterium]
MPWSVLLALSLGAGRAHPMHTTVTELDQPDRAGTATIRVRVFADDFEAAVALPADPAAADTAMARYLRGTLALADRTGRPVRLTWAGAERSGDVVLLRLTGYVPAGLAGARIASLVLCERFADQINIVRATYDGRVATLLFTRGEVSKALP